VGLCPKSFKENGCVERIAATQKPLKRIKGRQQMFKMPVSPSIPTTQCFNSIPAFLPKRTVWHSSNANIRRLLVILNSLAAVKIVLIV
jgi:hypothetical protein